MTDKNEYPQAPPLTKQEKRLLRRLRRQSGFYKKKNAEERARLNAELVRLAKENLERKDTEKTFAKNVAVAEKHSSRVYFKARWKFMTFAVTAAFVLLLTLYVLYAYVFVVDFVEVTGNTKYSAEQIISSSGISVGDRLYGSLANDDELSGTLAKQYPYIANVKVSRVIPNRIVIEVTEEEAVFVSEIHGEYALLSTELRVLELGKVAPAGNYIKLILPELKNAIAGKQIEFRDGMLEVALRAVSAVSSELMRDGTGVLDISDRFGIWIAYENRYKLVIGDINDIELKLSLAFEIMKDEAFEGGNKGTIYLENKGSPSVIIDNSITFE